MFSNIGIMSADSIDILIPIMMVLSGMFLIAIDEMRRSNNEK